MEPILKIENLYFKYGKEPLFDNLDLTVNAGLYGLLGRNGAGKSTLLKIISGQLKAHDGKCRTLGYNPENRNPHMLENMYYLPEEIYVPDLKGEAYVALNAPFYPRFSEEDFKNITDKFEVPRTKKLTTLSYGQKKKFLIAFALSTHCPLLLLDEPTNGLDIPSKSQFRQVAASLNLSDQAIVVSTHQVRDMEMLIDPVIIVEKGKIIMNNTMQQITDSYHMELQAEEPVPGEAVYWEKVLGGYSVVKEGPSEEDNTMDLEFVFNLATQGRGLHFTTEKEIKK